MIIIINKWSENLSKFYLFKFAWNTLKVCVTNIRDAKRKCTSKKQTAYDFRFVTKCGDHEFTCQ